MWKRSFINRKEHSLNWYMVVQINGKTKISIDVWIDNLWLLNFNLNRPIYLHFLIWLKQGSIKITIIWNLNSKLNQHAHLICIYVYQNLYQYAYPSFPAYSLWLYSKRSPQKFAQYSSWFGHLLSKCPNYEEDCLNLCGLLKKAELYCKAA